MIDPLNDLRALVRQAVVAGLADGTIRGSLTGDHAAKLIFSLAEGAMAFSLLEKSPVAAFEGQLATLLGALGVQAIDD